MAEERAGILAELGRFLKTERIPELILIQCVIYYDIFTNLTSRNRTREVDSTHSIKFQKLKLSFILNSDSRNQKNYLQNGP